MYSLREPDTYLWEGSFCSCDSNHLNRVANLKDLKKKGYEVQRHKNIKILYDISRIFKRMNNTHR